MFRGEEDMLEVRSGTLDFYDDVIGPYKGEIESWYVENQNIIVYFSLIFITIWVVLNPKSDLIWKVFKDLPIPPNDLKHDLNYPH